MVDLISLLHSITPSQCSSSYKCWTSSVLTVWFRPRSTALVSRWDFCFVCNETFFFSVLEEINPNKVVFLVYDTERFIQVIECGFTQTNLQSLPTSCTLPELACNNYLQGYFSSWQYCSLYWMTSMDRAVFIWVSKSNWFAFTMLRDWFKKLAPLFHPIRSKTKTNCDSLVRFFPRSCFDWFTWLSVSFVIG